MEHFNYLESKEFFYKKPSNFNKYSSKETLKFSLGAMLFMPSIMENLLDKIVEKKLGGASSIIICFEDSINDEDVEKGEQNVLRFLEELEKLIINKELNQFDLPLIFFRVRNETQFISITNQMRTSFFKFITGFVFPKFTSKNANRYLCILNNICSENKELLYFIPILETEEVMYKESRLNELNSLKLILNDCSNLLSIMVGSTDFCSLYGIRRPSSLSIYDINIINDCLLDIVNFFNRKFEEYSIIGSVWEYFDNKDYNLTGLTYKKIYKSIDTSISEEIDGLIKESILDKYNGFSGKCTIHPSQVKYINATYCVSYEEYMDAKAILNNKFGGAFKSVKENKMNEPKPHFNWARKVMLRANIYGVLKSKYDRIDLIK